MKDCLNDRQDIDRLVIEYYKEQEVEAVFVYTVYDVYKIFRGFLRKYVILSDIKAVRVIAYILRMKSSYLLSARIKSQQYFAMKDAFYLLSKKKVSVFFYNRIGKENSFAYSDSAKKRMKSKVSFPVMYRRLDKYEDDLKELFGSLFSIDYIKEVGKIPQVIKKGDVYCHEDCSSAYINVVGGKRVVCDQPPNYKKKIHIYGRCGVFGYAVEDKDTLPSQIQLYLQSRGYHDIIVINHGLWGGTDEMLDHNFLNDSMGFNDGDIIVFYRVHDDKHLIKQWEALGVSYKDFTHEWHNCPESKWCFYDKPGHMNNEGYKNVARLICEDLISNHFKSNDLKKNAHLLQTTNYLNYYLKSNRNNNFEDEINGYIESILNDHPVSGNDGNRGAIVMNCNPFTKGHRYLIESALKEVDLLYIFVVKEDKSFFLYEDRFEMVKQGTKDLENVVVVPSGKFIISTYTFPEYFMKDYVKEKEFDASLDVELFARYIAPRLKIRCRFAGEEPSDPVTRNYNEYMNRILPNSGIRFVEIPRMSLKGDKIVSATEVRRLLKLKDFDRIKDYVPQTTIEILKDKYSN